MVTKQIQIKLVGPYLKIWGPMMHKLVLEIVSVVGHLDASFQGYIQDVPAVPPLHEPWHDYLGFCVACHGVENGEEHHICFLPSIAVYY